MQSKSLVSRFFSRTFVGALFAAIWALGAPAALAQSSDLSVTKTGEVVNDGSPSQGKVRFTIVVTNDGGPPTTSFICTTRRRGIRS